MSASLHIWWAAEMHLAERVLQVAVNREKFPKLRGRTQILVMP